MIEDRDARAAIGASVRGSAFVVDPGAGLLATAKHVVKGMTASSLRVRSVYTIRGDYALGLVNTVLEIYEHPTKDFAVLRISPHGTKGRKAPLETLFSNEVGDSLAIFGFASGTDFVWCDDILGPGSPKSINPVVFHGHLAALVPDDGRRVEVLVYDATTFAGNSGGPVVSLETGEVVAVHLRSAVNQIGFGLPLVECASFIGQVVAREAAPTEASAPRRESAEPLTSYIAWEKKVSAEARGADVQDFLLDAIGTEQPTDLLDFDWDDPSGLAASSTVAYIQASASTRPVVLGRLDLAASILPPGIPRKLEEIRLKAAGEIWDIHQNDADPFPSNPHAHNVETRLKLDLSNGDLYRRAQKLKEIVTKKDLLTIRALATEKAIVLPPLAV